MFKNLIKILIIIIGKSILISSGIFIFIFWTLFLIKWLGFFLGLICALIFSPGIILFPFIYWLIEGIIPTYYFLWYGVAIIGWIFLIIGISYNKE